MTLILNPDALTCPHCYSLDLYCKWVNPAHAWAEFPHSYIGRDKTGVFRDAKAAGWVIHKDNTATCPKCRKLPKEKQLQACLLLRESIARRKTVLPKRRRR